MFYFYKKLGPISYKDITLTLDIENNSSDLNNIKFDSFGDLAATFRENNIPTYTELIMGLPGETLKTFKQGLENIAHTKIDTVFIYHCSVLPNAPMNVPEYREKYGIKLVKSPIMLVHSSIKNLIGLIPMIA